MAKILYTIRIIYIIDANHQIVKTVVVENGKSSIDHEKCKRNVNPSERGEKRWIRRYYLKTMYQ